MSYDHAQLERRFNDVVEALRRSESVSETPRTLLAWMGAQRRGAWVCELIRGQLDRHKLRTVPDFEDVYIDAPFHFALNEEQPDGPGAPGEGTPQPSAQNLSSEESVEAVVRLQILKPANTAPLTARPSETVQSAITRMLIHDYSQLPVMSENGDKVLGMISWRSLGRARVRGQPCERVEECIEQAEILRSDTSLLEAIDRIMRHGVVLVRNPSTDEICGLVTNSDLAGQFEVLARPFLLLREIEWHIRSILDRAAFSPQDLGVAIGKPNSAPTIHGLTFGNYIHILKSPTHWSRCRLPLDQELFVANIDDVRKIRNSIMHFNPEGISDDEMDALRRMATLLRFLSTSPRTTTPPSAP